MEWVSVLSDLCLVVMCLISAGVELEENSQMSHLRRDWVLIVSFEEDEWVCMAIMCLMCHNLGGIRL